MEVGQKQALGGGSHIRFKEAGGDWQDYDRGTMEKMGRGGYIDSAVGANATPEEWRSRVANPEAFSSYGESLDRVAQDAQLAAQRKLASDPFAAERFKTDEGIRQEQAKAGIGLATEQTRSKAYGDIANRQASDLAQLRSSPIYQRADQKKRDDAEAIIRERYAREIAAMERGSARFTGKTSSFDSENGPAF